MDLWFVTVGAVVRSRRLQRQAEEFDIRLKAQQSTLPVDGVVTLNPMRDRVVTMTSDFAGKQSLGA